MPNALVFGGAGQLGHGIARHLLNNGWQVTVTTNGGRTIQPALSKLGAQHIDANNKSRAAVLNDMPHTVDAVFDPTSYTHEDADDLIAGRGRFGSLVAVSSASVYCDTNDRTLDEADQTGFPDFGGPVTEDNPTVLPGDSTYSKRKVFMEKRILNKLDNVTILRPCAIYGPLARHPREWWFIKRALDKRLTIPISYNAESRFHTSSVNGIASLTQLCMENPATRILNVADPAALSVQEIANAIGTHLGIEFRLLPFPGAAEKPDYAGATPWSVATPVIVTCAKAVSLGWDGGEPYAVAIRETCKWILEIAETADWHQHFTMFQNYPYDPFNYGAEDNLIDALLNS